MGWRITPSSSKAVLLWHDNEGSIEFCKTLERWQCTNHFPGMWSIAHKVEFARAYARLSWTLPDIFNFHPKTFILPLQLDLLQTFMASFPKKSDRTIILKPDRGSQGRGIQLIQDYDDLDDFSDSAVAQVYLVPFLLHGKKFDLRIYVLVTSCDPLRAYIFQDGMVRFCTEDYQNPRSKNLDNDYAHLTNFSLNKKNASFDVSESKKSLKVVFGELAELGIDTEKVTAGIHRIVRLTLIAGQPSIASSYHTGIFTNDGKSRCFEILGFDILLDSDAKPWLLEVNCMPSLAAYSEFDNDLKTRVISGALTIVDLNGSFKARVIRRFRDTRAQKPERSDPLFNPERESEIARNTEYHQLLPVVDDPEMADLCERALVSVRDFGLPKRGQSPRIQEPEPRKATKRRAAKIVDPKKPPPKSTTVSVPKQAIVQKPPTLLNRVPRGVLLANEARQVRLNALSKKAPFGDLTPLIFRVFPPAHNSCTISEAEERERITAARRHAYEFMSSSLRCDIRALMPDGKHVVFDVEALSHFPVF
jgi:tubulin polyglutamylase TTLL6/13